MMSLGRSQNELLASNVCGKLAKVITNDINNGKEIAIKSAKVILDRVRNNKSLAKAIEKELCDCHPNLPWTFK